MSASFYARTVPWKVSPVIQQFLSQSNTLLLQQRLLCMLKERSGIPNLCVPIDQEFMNAMQTIADNNIAPQETQASLDALNGIFIKQELSLRLSGLTRHQLWHRYFMTDDRMKTMPYPSYEVETRGVNNVDTSVYTTASPGGASRHQQFLRDVMGIKGPRGPPHQVVAPGGPSALPGWHP